MMQALSALLRMPIESGVAPYWMAHLWDNVALCVLCFTLAGRTFDIEWPGAEWITPGFDHSGADD